ncbi:MAG: Holliday junction resolvase RuvX [Alphaproteobacteria bacterium]|nr:Holliday junction resolvase RuvX [Alphaproteobacteria bacterium]
MGDRNPAEFPALLAPGERLLGLDPGEKNIGVAICDPGLTVATSYSTLRRGKLGALIEELRAIVTAESIGGIVVGLPRNMDGTEGPKAQSARQFGRSVEKELGLPVALWDERLSTAAVTRTMIDNDTSRARRAEVVDKMAAAYILQGALDRIRASRTP